MRRWEACVALAGIRAGIHQQLVWKEEELETRDNAGKPSASERREVEKLRSQLEALDLAGESMISEVQLVSAVEPAGVVNGSDDTIADFVR